MGAYSQAKQEGQVNRDEFEKDYKIDPLQLDVECVRQAELFWKWSERAVKAQAEVERFKLACDLQKEEVKTIQARLELDCRKDPAAFGVPDGRLTEAAIGAAVATHEGFLKAQRKLQKTQERYLEKKETAALLDKAADTIEMKKKTLGDLIILHGQQYFAGPKVPRDLGGSYKRHQEEIQNKAHQKVLKVIKQKRGK